MKKTNRNVSSIIFIFAIFIMSSSRIVASQNYWYQVDDSLFTQTAQQACEILEARIAPGTLTEVLTFDWTSIANSQGAACAIGESPKYYPVFVKEENYLLFIPQQLQNLSCTVGNPIDPVSGSKMHVENVINLQGIDNLSFNLYYDSLTNRNWSHEFNKSASFSFSNEDDLEYNFSNTFIVDAELITKGVTFYNAAPTGEIPKGRLGGKSSTPAIACESNWINFKNNYSFNWIPSSTAKYIGDGKCEIRSNNQVMFELDVFGYYSGKSLEPYLSTLLPEKVYFQRKNGSQLEFKRITNSINYLNITNTGEMLSITENGNEITEFILINTNDSVEYYDVDTVSKTARVTSIQYINGNVLSFTYDGANLNKVSTSTGDYLDLGYESYGNGGTFQRLKTIVDKQGRVWSFEYTGTNNIEFIYSPGNTYKKFIYGTQADNLGLLIGIEDENRNNYAHWDYDSEHRAILSAHGNTAKVDKTTLNYSNGSAVNVTVSRESTTGNVFDIMNEYRTNTIDNSPIVSQIKRVNCVNCSNEKFVSSYNIQTGDVEFIEDKGLRTEYSGYDTKGNPGTIKEAVNTTEQRETTYTYDPRYHSKVATITEASVYPGKQKITTNQYDDFGNSTAVTIDGFAPDGAAVSRSTTLQYNGPYHQLTQIDGPRSDVSDIYTIDYYADNATEGNNRARMKRVTAPLSIMLYDNITYSPTGKIKTYIDANNVQTTFSYYYGNDRLQSLSQLDLNTTDNRLTDWTYLATGEVKTIATDNDPSDKTTLTFNYDDARRLTGIVDGLGNTIEYILDSEGNVEQENIKDNSGTLKKQLAQTFDDYNRLQLRTQVNEQFTETWLPNGTLDKTVDGKSVTTDYSYDNLKRLTQINKDMDGSSAQTANALTILNYDVQDNLTYVKNPVNGENLYSYDDLGNQLTRTSDDTGLTTYTHDDAGNITSMLDANGEITNYSYDALNRLTSVATSNAADDYQYDYDSCQNGAGRLCKVTGSSSVQHYSYDAFGNVTSQQALQYAYDTANRLQTISYPSGAIVHYDYDAAGQVSQVTLERNGSSVSLAANIDYEAFGDVTNLLYGNALTLSQSRDAAYRPLTQSILSVFELNYTQYDENGNLKQRDDVLTGTSSLFGYDAHNRLNTASGDFGTRSYEYDKNANRSKLTEDGVQTSSSYDPQSNRLSMRGVDNANLDNNGNMLDLGARGYSYTKHNRLFEVFDNGVLKATYQYNGLGQRISKTLADGSGKYFIYDTDGKLMAETDINGNILFEYIYLNGQLLAKYTPDSDSDGISNYEEDKLGTNPLTPDSDGDGLSDLDEVFIYGTSISNADTDGDGVSDSQELAFNSNPLDSSINFGDVNLNGEFNLGDYVVLMQFVMGTRTPNPTEELQADINHDGVLNVQDILLMQRVLLGLQVSWSDFSVENIKNLFAKIYQGIIPPAYAANGDGEIYYVHNDHLGTPIKMTNEIGQVVWQATYDPFGKATVNEDVDGDGKTVAMNVRFPGQYYDSETRLHYNYFRYYDPSIGRYIQPDKLDLIGRTNDPFLVMQGFSDDGWFEFNVKKYHSSPSVYPLQLNHLYVYANQNPLYWFDPFGLEISYWSGRDTSRDRRDYIALGDWISEPNGNLFHGFNRQDWKCSSIACILNHYPDMVERCLDHDQCYQDNACNSSSWISTFLGGTKSCNQCNSNF